MALPPQFCWSHTMLEFRPGVSEADYFNEGIERVTVRCAEPLVCKFQHLLTTQQTLEGLFGCPSDVPTQCVWEVDLCAAQQGGAGPSFPGLS